MQDSIRSYISTGLIHFMAYPNTMKGEGPIEETIRRIALDDYFDSIEVTWIKDPEVRKNCAKLLKESKMRVYYGGQPRLLTTGYNPNALDEEQRLIAEKTLMEGIDEAYEMGALGFAFLSGKYEEDKFEEAFAQLKKTTAHLCAYAKSKGDMRVALEVFDYDVDKCSIIGPASVAARFAKEMQAEYDNFGLMVDLSHLPLLHENCEQSLVPVAPYIIHAHMGNAVDPALPKDTPGYGDAHPRFGFPGGANDVPELAEYLRALIKVGYLKKGEPRTVSFEVKPFGDEDPEAVIANAKRTLNAAWELV